MATPAPTPVYSIARGGVDDLDPVMHVMHDAFGDRYGEAWTRSQCAGILPMTGIDLMLAREPSQELLGFSLSRSVADEAELLLIAVVSDHHRCGVGRALLDEFMARSAERGLERVHLEVRDGNPAIGLYRSAGFVPIGRRKNYYKCADGMRVDALTFARHV